MPVRPWSLPVACGDIIGGTSLPALFECAGRKEAMSKCSTEVPTKPGIASSATTRLASASIMA
jgi:hypothetical protein